MKGRCLICGGEADYSIRMARKQVLTRVGVVLLFFGLAVVLTLFEAWGQLAVGLLTLLFVGALSAGWQWICKQWEDLALSMRPGYRSLTTQEKEHNKRYEKQLKEREAAAEIESMLRSDPRRVRIQCQRCGPVQ